MRHSIVRTALLAILLPATILTVPASPAMAVAPCGNAALTTVGTTTTCTYTVAGGTDSFTVPLGVVTARFDLYGAQGGGALGGLGGRMAATLPVVAGTTFHIAVGRAGAAGQSGPPNGGGAGGVGKCYGASSAGETCGLPGFGGGGASQIDSGRRIPSSSTDSFYSDMVGGGGGGAGADARRRATSLTQACTALGAAGGKGGATNGSAAASLFDSRFFNGVLVGPGGGRAAVAATPGTGGAGGEGFHYSSTTPTEFDSAGRNGFDGVGPTGGSVNGFIQVPPGFGGRGGDAAPIQQDCGSGGGGGGGGGYAGGGGGGGGGNIDRQPIKATAGAGGGGGSNYAVATGLNRVSQVGARKGNGMIVITFTKLVG